MAAHAMPPPVAETAIDAAGVERPIARHMPLVMVCAIFVLGGAWWLAAQPPPGPGWNNPYGPQQPYPQGQAPPQQGPNPHPNPRPPESSGCSACTGADCGDCVSGIDCGDCASLADCGDCSGLDCSCVVSGASEGGKSCSLRGWKRLATSSGLLLPLFVLIGWRRRMRA